MITNDQSLQVKLTNFPPTSAVLALSHHIPPPHLPKNEVQICHRGLNIRDSDNPSPEHTCRLFGFQVLLLTPLALLHSYIIPKLYLTTTDVVPNDNILKSN